MFDLKQLCHLSGLGEALYEMEQLVNDSEHIIEPENKAIRLAFFRLLNVLRYPSTTAREMTRRLENVRSALMDCGYDDSDLAKKLIMACVEADAVVGYYHARGKHADRS